MNWNWKAKLKIFFKRLCCCNNNDYEEIKPPIRYDIYGDVFDINKFVIKHKGQ